MRPEPVAGPWIAGERAAGPGRGEAGLAAAAQALTALSAELRELADRIASGRDVDWCSTAAEAFRNRLEHQVRALHRTADGVSEAAAAVDRHAAAVRSAERSAPGGSW